MPSLTESPQSFASLRRAHYQELQKRNLELNSKEWAEKKIVLSSTPPRVFLQINAVCNADCVFCSKGYDYPLFELKDYEEKYARKLNPILRQAQEVILTGSGEFLGLPDASKILNHFNQEFPHVNKYIATNASHLRPHMCELIANSGSTYTLQLSLHASDRQTHELMMRYGAYDSVMDNIRTLMELRKKTNNTTVYFMFVMTALNVEKLPEFVRFAKEMGADKVLAGYFYIYESQQKYLSLYYKQDLANRMIDEARTVADGIGMPVQLPHKFGQNPATVPKPSSCIEPWTQFMVFADGGILPCDVYGNFKENLNQKDFLEIWNGAHYRQMRTALRVGGGCLTTCPRQNPAAVNHWNAHVIHRPKPDSAVVREYNEAMKKP